MRTGHWLIIAVLLGLLGATVWYLVKVWTETSGMPAYGYVAMGVGAVVALALGFGLMALMFYSNREGYDDSAQGSNRSEIGHDLART
jgi:cytoskeletal protein RodZ